MRKGDVPLFGKLVAFLFLLGSIEILTGVDLGGLFASTTYANLIIPSIIAFTLVLIVLITLSVIE